jgi:DNA uptake protein ComE-like DNA-binding protein
MKLGLSEKQSAVILKFTKYGIYSLDKLERIFVIPPELFALIKDSVYFPDRWEKINDQYDRSVNKVTLPKSIIELNTSSQEQLESIKGVGPFFAKQIIRYRERLGGYISIDQLSEVWKMNDSISERISPYLDIDPTQLRKLNINQADIEELKNHPYITWNMANSIVKMRAQLGSFKYLEELKKSKLISDETFEKIKPYLTL